MKYVLTIALLVLSWSARAELQDHGSYTIDTDTGLQWLDVTESLDISYNEMIVLLDDQTSEFYGYRHASGDEAAIFASAVENLPVHIGADSIDFSNGRSAEALTLISLIGETASPSAGSFSYGLTSDPANTSNISNYALSVAATDDYGYAAVRFQSLAADGSNAEVGHMLVKAAPPSTPGLNAPLYITFETPITEVLDSGIYIFTVGNPMTVTVKIYEHTTEAHYWLDGVEYTFVDAPFGTTYYDYFDVLGFDTVAPVVLDEPGSEATAMAYYGYKIDGFFLHMFYGKADAITISVPASTEDFVVGAQFTGSMKDLFLFNGFEGSVFGDGTLTVTRVSTTPPQ